MVQGPCFQEGRCRIVSLDIDPGDGFALGLRVDHVYINRGFCRTRNSSQA